MNIINSVAGRIFLISCMAFIAACNTVPTSSSSSSGSPPSSSSGSSSSSSSSSGSGSQSSSSSSSSSQGSSGSGGQSSSQAGATGAKAGSQGASASQSGSMAKSEKSGGAGSANGQAAKTDDEILADALGEFDKGLKKAPAAGKEQGGESPGNAAGNATGDTAGNGQGEMTEEEKAGILEAQLNNKFAKFDNLMLGEREKIAKGDNEAGSGGGAYGSGDGEDPGDDQMQTAMVDQPAPAHGSGFPGDKMRDDISPAPGDVGDGQDDDIIARQLREAAQKEQDPELRAKLWDEYRKYKKGA